MESLDVLSDDYGLLAIYKQGDRSSYEEIYNRYRALLYSHTRRILQSDEDAKDLVQDVFSDGPTLELQTTHSASLYSIMRYNVFDLIDRKKGRSLRTVMREVAQWYNDKSFTKENFQKEDSKERCTEALSILSYFGAHFHIEAER